MGVCANKSASKKYQTPSEIPCQSSLTLNEVEIRNINQLKKKLKDNVTKMVILGNEFCHSDNSQVSHLLHKKLLQCSALRELVVRNTSIKQLSAKLPNLLIDLNLTSNKLGKTPKIDQGSRQLRSIDLSFNKINKISENLKSFTNLVDINMKKNKIQKIKSDIFESMPQLENLNLSKNALSTFSLRLTPLRHLKLLDISFNQVSELNLELFESSSLTTLLLNNNPLTQIPSSIEFLDLLETLDISNTKIQRLPNAISKLEKLIILRMDTEQILYPPSNIASKGICAIRSYLAENYGIDIGTYTNSWEGMTNRSDNPEALKKLVKIHLKDVGFDISDETNTTYELNCILEKTVNLEELYIHSSNLTDMPFAIPSNLCVLSLRNNSIDSLSDYLEFLTNLKFLDLSENCFKVVPHCISQLKLENLNMASNHIEEIEQKALDSMKTLRFLNLSHNSLTDLNLTLKHLSSLEVLNLSFNSLVSIKNQAFAVTSTNLSTLLLNDNPLKHLPSFVSKLGNLKYLELHNTSLETLPWVISQITNLQSLTLPIAKMKIPPSPICENGLSAIKEYLQNLKNTKNSNTVDSFYFMDEEDNDPKSKKIRALVRKITYKKQLKTLKKGIKEDSVPKFMRNNSLYKQSSKVIKEISDEAYIFLKNCLDEQADLDTMFYSINAVRVILDKVLKEKSMFFMLDLSSSYYSSRIERYKSIRSILEYIGLTFEQKDSKNCMLTCKFSSNRTNDKYINHVKNRAKLILEDIEKFVPELKKDHMRDLCRNNFSK